MFVRSKTRFTGFFKGWVTRYSCGSLTVYISIRDDVGDELIVPRQTDVQLAFLSLFSIRRRSFLVDFVHRRFKIIIPIITTASNLAVYIWFAPRLNCTACRRRLPYTSAGPTGFARIVLIAAYREISRRPGGRIRFVARRRTTTRNNSILNGPGGGV